MPEATEGSSATVRLELDKGLKGKWEESRKKITDAQHDGATSFYSLWKSVAEVVDHSPPMFLAEGFSSATAFFEKFLKVPRRSAIRNIQVVRRASRADVERFGVAKLDAALELFPVGTELSFEQLRIAVQRKGKTSKVALTDASVDEVRLAVRALRPKPPAQARSVTSALAMLNKALSTAKIEGVTVQMNKSGITFRGVRAEGLKLLGAVLTRIELPENPRLLKVA